MKVLFDQNTPRPLARLLAKHRVFTAADKGWERLKNGDLLDAAEADGFGAMVTTDTNLSYQQNLEGRKLALVILPVGRWPKLWPHLAEIVEVVDQAEPGSYREIEALPRAKPPSPARKALVAKFVCEAPPVKH